MAGKKVIIRTLDIGADKQVGFFCLGKKENPGPLKPPSMAALSLRSIAWFLSARWA